MGLERCRSFTANLDSAVLASHGPVSSGNTKVSASLDYPRSGCEGSAVSGTALKQRFSEVRAHRKRNEKTYLVRLRHVRQASCRRPIIYGLSFSCRTLSMTFGRPLAIPEEYVKIGLPALIDEPPTVEDTNSIQNTKATSVPFFNATMWVSTTLISGLF